MARGDRLPLFRILDGHGPRPARPQSEEGQGVARHVDEEMAGRDEGAPDDLHEVPDGLHHLSPTSRAVPRMLRKPERDEDLPAEVHELVVPEPRIGPAQEDLEASRKGGP